MLTKKYKVYTLSVVFIVLFIILLPVFITQNFSFENVTVSAWADGTDDGQGGCCGGNGNGGEGNDTPTPPTHEH